jgi:hypothetical protein
MARKSVQGVGQRAAVPASCCAYPGTGEPFLVLFGFLNLQMNYSPLTQIMFICSLLLCSPDAGLEWRGSEALHCSHDSAHRNRGNHRRVCRGFVASSASHVFCC